MADRCLVLVEPVSICVFKTILFKTGFILGSSLEVDVALKEAEKVPHFSKLFMVKMIYYINNGIVNVFWLNERPL